MHTKRDFFPKHPNHMCGRISWRGDSEIEVSKHYLREVSGALT